LQRLGAEVIAVDDHPGAPAHGVADQSLVVAMTDTDELSALIGGLRPDFVVSLADGISVNALDALAAGPNIHDHNLIELVPSARSVRITADRRGCAGSPPISSACQPRRSGLSARSANSSRSRPMLGIRCW